MFASPYANQVLSQAEQQYPFISQYRPVVVGSKRSGDDSETWFPGDSGDANDPRPTDIPLDRVGVEVMRPGAFSPEALACVMIHVDAWANATRGLLGDSLSPVQLAALKRESGDYQQSLQMKLPPQQVLNNGIDSAMRGYTVGQWPADANARMNYTPQQIGWLDSLRTYMQQGVYPLDYRLPSK
jgi:hypothetical protein